jgi:hypothetical protein
MATARRVAAAETPDTARTDLAVTAAEFARMVGRPWPDAPAGPLTRGAAGAWLGTAPAPAR